MEYIVTARWIGCKLHAVTDVVDIIEVNNKYYFYVAQDIPNKDFENMWNAGVDFTGRTLEDVRDTKDPLGILNILDKRNPDWIFIGDKPSCVCGGQKLKLPHSDWCPQYL